MSETNFYGAEAIALQVDDFVKIRPYLHHLTDARNLEYIRETRTLAPASSLMKSFGRADLLRRRRGEHERITAGNRSVMLRDQAPLHKGNLALPDGYAFEDFVENLNSRVFFWPGTATGPISYGVRHFERYRSEDPVLLRVSFQSLAAVNATAEPLYCKYNSGSPRCSRGEKSPRGPSTFLPALQFNGRPSQVVEVTFDRKIVIPANVEVGHDPGGPWHSLL